MLTLNISSYLYVFKLENTNQALAYVFPYKPKHRIQYLSYMSYKQRSDLHHTPMWPLLEFSCSCTKSKGGLSTIKSIITP